MGGRNVGKASAREVNGEGIRLRLGKDRVASGRIVLHVNAGWHVAEPGGDDVTGCGRMGLGIEIKLNQA